MQLMFELSKEQQTLPCAEVLACLDAVDAPCSIIDSNEDVLIVQIKSNQDALQQLAQRLALTFFIDELLFSCEARLESLASQVEKHPLISQGSVAIRCKNRSSSLASPGVVDFLGSYYTKNRKVDLQHPDLELRALTTENTIYVGVKQAGINTSQYQLRRAHHRPFFSPISLHPKIARALVNVSSLKKNGTILDPFCGTGGILLEAGLIGARVIGSDIQQQMVSGCKRTLDYYHITAYSLEQCDIGDVAQHTPPVDAVVTDFPYGKATTTKGENLTTLYDRAFQSIASILKKNGKAVIGLSEKKHIELGKKYLSFIESHELRVHRSLTRYFAVYRK